MLVDANVLLYAVDADSPFHERARVWLVAQINGQRRVGMPWVSLTAFLRIATHPRASKHPLAPEAAWRYVKDWLDCETVWIPAPTGKHREVLAELLARHECRGNLVSDAHVAALAIEHGLEVCSADSDFALFPEIRWQNPLLTG